MRLIDADKIIITRQDYVGALTLKERLQRLLDFQPTVKAIPVEWIYKWLENIPKNWRGYADDWNYNIESEVKKIVYKNNTVILLPCITDMLDDWMEENK